MNTSIPTVFCQILGDYGDNALTAVESGIQKGALAHGVLASTTTQQLKGFDKSASTARLIAQQLLRIGRQHTNVSTVSFLNIAPRENGTPEPFALMELADGQLVVTTVGQHLRELKPHIKSLRLLKETPETAAIFDQGNQFRSRDIAETVVPLVIDARINKQGIEQEAALFSLFDAEDISGTLPSPIAGHGTPHVVEPDDYGNIKTGLNAAELAQYIGKKVSVTFKRDDGTEKTVIARVNKGLFNRLKPDGSFSNVGPFKDDEQALTLYAGSDAYPLSPGEDDTVFAEFAAQHADAGAFLNVDGAAIVSIQEVPEETDLTLIPRGKHRGFAEDKHFDYDDAGVPHTKGYIVLDDDLADTAPTGSNLARTGDYGPTVGSHIVSTSDGLQPSA